MTSEAVLEREYERIFERCWLYLGHESEVPNPGDFKRRSIAGRPVFFARGEDGRVRCFFNTCPHRGAQICRLEQGNAKVFQCFYHAWSFNTRGDLIGIPDRAGYGPYFDPAQMGLQSPARIDEYRGFYFVSFNHAVESLSSYLGLSKHYLDLIVDQSEAGMRVIPGSNRYTLRANWKLLLENSLDGYHLATLHRSYIDYQKSFGVESSDFKLVRSAGIDLGHGHAVMENPAPYGKPLKWSPAFGEEARADIENMRARLVARHGEERAAEMTDLTRNLLIFPNLVINDGAALTIRQCWPLTPGTMDVTVWELAPKDEEESALTRRLNNFLTFLGMGGFASPDDVEALESCQLGFEAKEVMWSDLSRGMHRKPLGTDDAEARAFWREWHASLTR